MTLACSSHAMLYFISKTVVICSINSESCNSDREANVSWTSISSY